MKLPITCVLVNLCFLLHAQEDTTVQQRNTENMKEFAMFAEKLIHSEADTTFYIQDSIVNYRIVWTLSGGFSEPRYFLGLSSTNFYSPHSDTSIVKFAHEKNALNFKGNAGTRSLTIDKELRLEPFRKDSITEYRWTINNTQRLKLPFIVEINIQPFINDGFEISSYGKSKYVRVTSYIIQYHGGQTSYGTHNTLYLERLE
jgi:hypothetical protein